MKDVDNYSEEALKATGKDIRDYERKIVNGTIIIKYGVFSRAKAAGIGAAIGAAFLSPHMGALIGALVGGCTPYCHYFDSRSGELLSDNQNQAAEELNKKGCRLFENGQFTDAADYHRSAFETCSSEYPNKQTFKKDRDRAEIEARAKSISARGDDFFKCGHYKEAYIKYKEAYDLSQVPNQRSKYATDRDRAHTEAQAKVLNAEGDDLFNQGNFEEALKKYQQAYDTSKMMDQRNVYVANRDRAQTEAQAKILNAQGDDFFNQGDYEEALKKYQQACDTSKVMDQRNVYAIKRNRAETAINKLSILDASWNEAWAAENDAQYDRSEEATEIFQRVLNESKNNLKTFPNSLRFKQYEIISTLKLEGNELFNQGLELQQKGIQYLKEAKGFQSQGNYKSANLKFKEAENKLLAARGKFETGSKSDQRFVSCIELIQCQLKEINSSIKVTEQHDLNDKFDKLDINDCKDDRSDTNIFELGQQMVYNHQI